MKKIFLTIAIAAVMVGCAQDKNQEACDKSIELLEQATQKIEKAQTLDEVQNIATEMQAEALKLDKEYPDVKLNDEQEKKVNEAMEKFQQAAQEAGTRIGTNMLGQ